MLTIAFKKYIWEMHLQRVLFRIFELLLDEFRYNEFVFDQVRDEKSALSSILKLSKIEELQPMIEETQDQGTRRL